MERFHKFALFVFLHLVPLAAILYFSISILAKPGTQNEGIVKLSVIFHTNQLPIERRLTAA